MVTNVSRFCFDRVNPVRSVIVLLIYATVLAGCAESRDSFRGDTDNKRLQLTLSQTVSGDKSVMVGQVMGYYGEQLAGFQVLTKTLPVGGKLIVSVMAPEEGEYREGGSEIFLGHKYTGTHPVATEIISAESSRPEVLKVRVTERDDLSIEAISTGKSTVTLKARKSGERSDRTIIEDSVDFEVQP